MSSNNRYIANDGAGWLTTDAQAVSDVGAHADDRVYETLVSPGSAQKVVLPLSIESPTTNPRQLLIPSPTNGAVRVLPALFECGTANQNTTLSLSVTQQTALDSALIAPNSSGANRYDLLYCSVQRTVSKTASRMVKNVSSSGTIAAQTINVLDSPTVTLGIVTGFATGATFPSPATIAAALPSDVPNATFPYGGTFFFSLGVITTSTGYGSGTAITAAQIQQTWNGGWIQPQRMRSHRPMSIYYGSANEKPASFLTSGTQGAERWGSDGARFFGHCKLLTTTGQTVGTGVVLDNTIDWRNRIVYGFYSVFAGFGGTALPLEGYGNVEYMGSLHPRTIVGANPEPVINGGVLPPVWTGPGVIASAGPLWQLLYEDVIAGSALGAGLAVDQNGNLIFFRTASLPAGVAQGPYNAVGDVVILVLYASDKMSAGA